MITPLQPTDTLLSVRRASHAFDLGGLVLDDVTLHVRERQLTGIVGPSGSGKTTLLRVLLGSIAPLHGEVSRRAGLRVG